MAGRYHYAPDSRVLTVGERRISLTEREGAALLFLMRHAGEVVARDTLETEVWGMRPGVRSQTVPVTLRRLRRKLGPDDRIETVWGQGWRLPAEERALREAPPRPVYTTALQPREELAELAEAALRATLVTVVGPGGVGKTRLVDTWLTREAHPHVWVTVLPSDRREDLVRRIATQGSIHSDVADEVAEALRDSWVVVDDAECALEVVREVVASAGSTRFVLTSREPLGVPGERVVALRGLRGDPGRAFLRARIAGSPWGRAYGDSVLDRVLRVVDGLPLALELATAQPEPLDVWVERVEREGMSGPDADRMARSVGRSLSRLDAAQRSVLSAIALSQAPVDERDLEGWLGPSAVSIARGLGARSLLTWDRGWRVLGTVARQLPADPEARAVRDAWLCRWVAALDLDADPIGASERLEPVADELLAMVPRLEASDARPVVLALCELFAIRGPARAVADAAVAGARAHPADPLLFGLSCLASPRPDGTRLRAALASEDVGVRAWALWVHGSIDPRTLPLDVLDATLEALEHPGLALRLERIRLRARKWQGHPVRLDAMWDLERRARGFPHVHGRLIGELAAALDAAGDPERALALMEMETPTGITVLDLHLGAAVAFLWCARNPDEGVHRLEAVAVEAVRFGQRAWAGDLRAYAAIFAYVAGRPWSAPPPEGAGGLRADVVHAIDSHEAGGTPDLAALPEPFRVALEAIWSGEAGGGVEALAAVRDTRDTRILKALLRGRSAGPR